MSSRPKVVQILHNLSNNSNPLPLPTTDLHGGPVDGIEQGHDNHEYDTDHKVDSKYRVGGGPHHVWKASLVIHNAENGQ